MQRLQEIISQSPGAGLRTKYPEMAITVGDVSPQQATELFCTLNFAQIDRERQARALTDTGMIYIISYIMT